MSYGWALLQMLGALLVVCLLIFVIFRFALRRLVGPLGPPETLELLARRALSPRSALWIVRAGGRAFLLGATDQQISLLAELDSADAAAGTLASSAQHKPFHSLLAGLGGRPAGADSSKQALEGAAPNPAQEGDTPR